MKTVKVTVKREQFFEQLCADWGTLDYRAFSPNGQIVNAKISGPLPLEFTLELPVEQIATKVFTEQDIKEAAKHANVGHSYTATGIMPIEDDEMLYFQRKVNKERNEKIDGMMKRKRYKIVEPPLIISEMSKYSTQICSFIRDGTIIELEEVE